MIHEIVNFLVTLLSRDIRAYLIFLMFFRHHSAHLLIEARQQEKKETSVFEYTVFLQLSFQCVYLVT